MMSYLKSVGFTDLSVPIFLTTTRTLCINKPLDSESYLRYSFFHIMDYRYTRLLRLYNVDTLFTPSLHSGNLRYRKILYIKIIVSKSLHPISFNLWTINLLF